MKTLALSALVTLGLTHAPQLATANDDVSSGPTFKVSCFAKQSLRGESPLIVEVPLVVQATDRMTLTYAGQAPLGLYRVSAAQTSRLPNLNTRTLTITDAQGDEVASTEIKDHTSASATFPDLTLKASLDWDGGRKRQVICLFSAN